MAAYDTDGWGTLSAEELQRMGAQGGRIFMADGDVRPNDSLRDTSDFRQLLLVCASLDFEVESKRF